MVAPAVLNEHDALLAYLDDNLQALRNAAHGLTDAQARQQPTRSSLSVAGLLKHVTWVLWTLIPSADGEQPPVPPQDFYASFTPAGDEPLETVLGWFDEARVRYLAAVAALDPDEVFTVAAKPWEGITDERPASRRLTLIHHVEEFARHAGHADILREQLDGATALPLRMAVEGIPGNAYAQPWQPA